MFKWFIVYIHALAVNHGFALDRTSVCEQRYLSVFNTAPVCANSAT
jgi:hypothetical protein